MTAPLPPALFVAAHPDDETLAMGVAIAEHVTAGRDTHVLLLTDGGTTSARAAINGTTVSPWWGVTHDPAAEGYTALSEADCAAARIREAGNAIRALASPGTATVHRALLQDGAYTQGEVETAIVAVADLIAPGAPVHVKTHTWLVDNHPDHLAAGLAAKALNLAQPTRFPAIRYYVLSTYFADPRLAQVSDTFDYPTGATITAKVRNACKAYGAWAPPETYAVGQHSVSGLFTTLTGNPRSLVHP